MKKDFVYVTRNEGNYNLLNTSETSVCYVFQGISQGLAKEKDLKTSYVLSPDYDYVNSVEDSPVKIAMAIKEGLEEYLFNSDKKRIKSLIEYLEEIEGENTIRRLKYEVEQAVLEVKNSENRLDKALMNLGTYMLSV